MRISAYRVVAWTLLISLSQLGIAGAQERGHVAPNGETILTANLGRSKVRITFKTHTVENGTPSQPREDALKIGCTNSRFPCVLVDVLTINVAGTTILVPRSLVCDLSDVGPVEVSRKQGKFVLTVYGGDASESYFMKIEFDSTRVLHMILYDVEANEPLEERTYYHVSM
jgi:hypothetical protein